MKYPLKTQKQGDFLLFADIIMKMDRGEHLTMDGIQTIINLRASLNQGLSQALKEAFPNYLPNPRPEYSKVIVDPSWLSGFISAYCCFSVNILKSRTHKTGLQVMSRFIIAQDLRDRLLIKSLVEYLNCGTYSESSISAKNSMSIFTITKIKDLEEKLIPLLDKYTILGAKSQDYSDFKRVVKLMRNKVHLTPEGIKEIKDIKSGMNKGRINN